MPAIHDLNTMVKEDVDTRHKAEHDVMKSMPFLLAFRAPRLTSP
jgi:hypothetical protein